MGRSWTATGSLVGINSAIYSETGANGGIGFAIPVNNAIDIADQLIASARRSTRSWALSGPLDAELVKTEKLPVEQGAVVLEVTKGTDAEKAGVKAGDVIVGSTPMRFARWTTCCCR